MMTRRTFVLVAAIVAALWSVALHERVEEVGEQAVDCLFQTHLDNCELPGVLHDENDQNRGEHSDQYDDPAVLEAAVERLPDGTQVDAYTIRNTRGTTMQVISWKSTVILPSGGSSPVPPGAGRAPLRRRGSPARRLRQLVQPDPAAARAGVPVPNALVARYLAILNGKLVGRAYVDTHVVRTKKESLLIVLDEHGAVRRIEVTAFLEPPEYQASSLWYAQYKGKALNNDLHLQRAIRSVAGATLTALAANQAVRRVLAIDQVLRQGKGAGDGS